MPDPARNVNPSTVTDFPVDAPRFLPSTWILTVCAFFARPLNTTARADGVAL